VWLFCILYALRCDSQFADVRIHGYGAIVDIADRRFGLRKPSSVNVAGLKRSGRLTLVLLIAIVKPDSRQAGKGKKLDSLYGQQDCE